MIGLRVLTSVCARSGLIDFMSSAAAAPKLAEPASAPTAKTPQTATPAAMQKMITQANDDDGSTPAASAPSAAPSQLPPSQTPAAPAAPLGVQPPAASVLPTSIKNVTSNPFAATALDARYGGRALPTLNPQLFGMARTLFGDTPENLHPTVAQSQWNAARTLYGESAANAMFGLDHPPGPAAPAAAALAVNPPKPVGDTVSRVLEAVQRSDISDEEKRRLSELLPDAINRQTRGTGIIPTDSGAQFEKQLIDMIARNPNVRSLLAGVLPPQAQPAAPPAPHHHNPYDVRGWPYQPSPPPQTVPQVRPSMDSGAHPQWAYPTYHGYAPPAMAPVPLPPPPPSPAPAPPPAESSELAALRLEVARLGTLVGGGAAAAASVRKRTSAAFDSSSSGGNIDELVKTVKKSMDKIDGKEGGGGGDTPLERASKRQTTTTKAAADKGQMGFTIDLNSDVLEYALIPAHKENVYAREVGKLGRVIQAPLSFLAIYNTAAGNNDNTWGEDRMLLPGDAISNDMAQALGITKDGDDRGSFGDRFGDINSGFSAFNSAVF